MKNLTASKAKQIALNTLVTPSIEQILKYIESCAKEGELSCKGVMITLKERHFLEERGFTCKMDRDKFEEIQDEYRIEKVNDSIYLTEYDALELRTTIAHKISWE